MRFVITPKDPTAAHVNQDMKGTEKIAQVIFFLNLVILYAFESIAVLLLFFFYRNHSLDTAPQRPPWGQKRVAVVDDLFHILLTLLSFMGTYELTIDLFTDTAAILN